MGWWDLATRTRASCLSHRPPWRVCRVASYGFGIAGFFFNGGFILVSDYVRMEITLVDASWDVVAGVQTGCGLHSYEALWSTELPCAFS